MAGPFASALRFAGVAKEATKGTFVAATDYIPITKFDAQDTTTWIEDTGLRGSMVARYNKVAGPLFSEISMGGDVFPDSIGYVLSGFFGEVATTGASAPFTHTFDIQNTGSTTQGQPTAFSFTDYQSVEGRGYPGQQVTDLQFTWDGEKALKWDAKSVGFASATQTKPTQSFSGVTLLPGWLCAFKIAGSTSLQLVDAQISLKRPVKPINTADGTQAPLAIWAGPAEATGKCVIVVDTITQLTNYLAGTKTALDFNWAQGAGAAAVQFNPHFTNCNYDLVKTGSGKDYVEYEITWEALGNTTDVGTSGGYSIGKTIIQNAKPAATYA